MTIEPPPPPPPSMPPPPPGYGPPAAQWTGPALATWPVRVGGSLIDGLIVAVPYVILLKAVPALALLWNLGASLYLQYLQGTTGQTPGKKVMGIKLVRESDGQYVGFPLAIGRSILHILDVFSCGLGLLWPIWDAKRQTFADKVVSTLVVRA